MRRVGFKADSEGTEDPRFGRARTVGHPTGGVVGLGSLVELELTIRVFAKNKFRKESLGHPACQQKIQKLETWSTRHSQNLLFHPRTGMMFRHSFTINIVSIASSGQLITYEKAGQSPMRSSSAT